jgi:thiol-disulfide isomerase/thioredoxin
MVKRNVLWLAILCALAGAQPQGLRAEASSKAVPDAVSRAFQAAGIPVLRERMPPVGFTLRQSGGGNLSLKNLEGKVVFLNFWATWCGPCRVEMPAMESLYRGLKDRGFEILAVNVQESEKDVADFMRQNRLSFPALLDSGSAAARYGIRAFPTTYIIDRDGLIIARVIGSLNWNSPQMVAAFETLLNN